MTYTMGTTLEWRIMRGQVPGHSMWNALGYRVGASTTATGEDVWPGTATSLPVPSPSGDALEVVSSSVNDTSAGTGVRTVSVHCLDVDGTAFDEEIALNGTTPVPLVDTSVRFVNDMHALTVGSNNVAAGNITVRKISTPTDIYNMIALGGNKSLVSSRMVPAGHTLYVTGWHAAEANGKRTDVRLRSTDYDGVLTSAFLFKDHVELNANSSGHLEAHIVVPALSIIKVTGWSSVAGADVSCSWSGILVAD